MNTTTLLLAALTFSLLLGQGIAKGEYGGQKLTDDNMGKNLLEVATAREHRMLQEPTVHPTHPPRRRVRTPSPTLWIAPTSSPSEFPSHKPSAVPTETNVITVNTIPSAVPTETNAPTVNVNPRNAPTFDNIVTSGPTRTESPSQEQSCVTLLPFFLQSTTQFEDTDSLDEALSAYLNVYFSAREPDIIEVDIPPPKPEILFRRLQRQQELTYSLPYDDVQACFPIGSAPEKSVLDEILIDSLTKSLDTFLSFLQFALDDDVAIPDVTGSTFENSEPPSPAPSNTGSPSVGPSAITPTDSPRPSPAPSGIPSSGPSTRPTITPMPTTSQSPTFVTRHITVLPFNVLSSDPIEDRQALLEATVAYLNTNFATDDEDFVEFRLEDIGSQTSGSGDSLQISGIGIYKGDSPVSFDFLNDEVRKLLDDNFSAFQDFISFAIPFNPPTLVDVVFDRTPAPSISRSPSSTPSVSDAPTGTPTDSTPPSESAVPTNAPSVSDEPTSTPTVSSVPSLSQAPTLVPSISDAPTSTPTKTALPTATLVPSWGPSISDHPSLSPTQTAKPSISTAPSIAPSEQPSLTSDPSVSPSFVPSLSLAPSIGPSSSPSMSHEPSRMPSESPSSSLAPSQEPSEVPSVSLAPSETHVPSIMPSELPSEPPSTSLAPSATPSAPPTPAPTNSVRLLTEGTAIDNMHFLLHARQELAETLDSRCSCVNCNEDANCGGLWLGKSVQGGDPSRFTTIHLVISHCQHPLDWVEEYTRGFTIDGITIVSKCGMQIVGMPTFTKTQVIQLANVGRCDHTYASWIAEAVSSEAMTEHLQPTSVIVFLKDDISQKHLHQVGFRRSFSEMLRIASARDFACGIEPSSVDVNGEATSLSVYHETQQLLSFHLDDYQRGNYVMDGHGDTFGSRFSDMGDWAATIGLKFDSPVTPVCYGGVFAVRGSQLVGKDYIWKELETSLLRGNNIEEGHFVERSWAHILSPPTSSTQIQEIVRYSNGIAENESSYSGTLTHVIGQDA